VCRASKKDEPGLVFFAPDVTEISTLKRVAAFHDNGMRPLTLSFRRVRCNRDFQPSWPHVALGRTHDGHYWQRAWAVVTAIPKLLGVRSRLNKVPIFYARNLDLLILALLARRLFNPGAMVAYEVLDIQPAFLGPSWKAMMLRWIERRCLRRVALLVLSSPGFLRNYYSGVQGYGGRWFLQENKLHRSVLAFLPAAPRADGAERTGRWVVGYFGLIRGETTIRLMRRLADRLGKRILFRFRGVFTTVEEERFRLIFDGRRNVVNEGEYAHPQELGEIYGGVDFGWAIDLEDTRYNSRWALPNRFYEAGICGVPCLAVSGFELGAMIDRMGVGLSFAEPLEETLVSFFERLGRQDYEARRRRLAALPRSSFVAGEDAAALCGLLKGAAGGSTAAYLRTITSQ
jgi:succinoglycan biosynthesis protein ExoL